MHNHMGEKNCARK